MDRNDLDIGYVVNCDTVSSGWESAKIKFGTQFSHILPIKSLNANPLYKNFAIFRYKKKHLSVYNNNVD